MLRVLSRGARLNPVSQQLLAHPLTEEWTQERGGVQVCFLCFPSGQEARG